MPKDPYKDKKKKADLLWLVTEVKNAQDENFYGKLELILEDGRLRRLIQHKSKVPPTGD